MIRCELRMALDSTSTGDRLYLGNLNLGGGWPLVWRSDTLVAGLWAFQTFGTDISESQLEGQANKNAIPSNLAKVPGHSDNLVCRSAKVTRSK